ncbi:MAG: hypothetical protein JW787_11380 [Sedimentisphaerales bacterium]|nr:hypothetical protein [Sedimentisphaerales bacterium]
MGQELRVIYENVKPNMPDFNALNLNLNVRDLWPIAILCGLAILLTLLWTLAVWEYLRRINMHSLELSKQLKRSTKMPQNQL